MTIVQERRLAMKRVLSIIVVFTLAFSCLAVPASASSPVLPYRSDNINDYQYRYDQWSAPISSYLYKDGDYLIRVEHTGNRVVVEEYDQTFRMLSQRGLSLPLPIWGGFFAGEDYNFIIVGQSNYAEDDSKEVIRVIKYDKDWNEIGFKSISDINTVDPFAYGSLRCAEDGENLYIHTCHEMYTSYDGLNHQSNLSFALNKEDLSIQHMSGIAPALVDQGFDFYASHSFNQYILVDQVGDVIALDHGDAYPRSAVMSRATFGSSVGYPRMEQVEIQQFAGEIGGNWTDASLGGLAETWDGYITAYHYQDANVYLSFTPKDNFSETATKVVPVWQSDEDSADVTPILVSTGLDGGYVLWYGNEEEDLYCVPYDSKGNVGERRLLPDGVLSDCQPICVDGNVIWYVTDDGSPTFYVLSEDESSIHRAVTGTVYQDVDASDWYCGAVEYAYANNLMNGVGDGLFSPQATLTRAQAVQVLYNLEWNRREEEPYVPWYYQNPFLDVFGWFEKPVVWAYNNGIVAGISNTHFAPHSPVTREQFAVMLYHYAEYRHYDLSAQADLTTFPDNGKVSSWAKRAMQWANGEGLINGSDGSLLPGGTATRGQAASILMNFDKNVAK